MALSEEEQRLLDELEASLAADDPRFAHKLGSASPSRPDRKGLMYLALGCLLGIILLVIGMRFGWPISVVGYLVMFASVFGAVFSSRNSAKPHSAPKDRKSDPSVIGKFEDRWNKRQQGGL